MSTRLGAPLLALLACLALASCGMSEKQMQGAILDAIKRDDSKQIKSLLEKKPALLRHRLGPDGLGYWAASHPKALKVLLEAGLDPNEDTPLLHTKSAEAAELLLDRGDLLHPGPGVRPGPVPVVQAARHIPG